MVAPVVQRRLAAIMAADVVDYSRLMGDDEESTLHLLVEDRKLIETIVTSYRGRIFGVAGDSMMGEFASAVEGVLCAVEIQRQLAARNAQLCEDRRMRFRIGVSIGDVMVDGDNLYGDGVNVAARLEQLSGPEEICISNDVYRHARRKTALEFDDLGEHKFKNIAESVRVYRVVIPGPDGGVGIVSPETATPGTSSVVGVSHGSVARGKPAIAILPFENLSGDEEQEYFCDGLTNDITTDLSRFQTLFVIAAMSAFTYKGKQAKSQDVGRELGVQYVLEGSVQKVGDRLRVNTQLIDAGTGYHLWAERFNRNITDLFEVQDEIIQLIVSALAVSVDAIERERVLHKSPAKISAYDAILRGFHVWGSHLSSDDTADALFQSRHWYQLATDLDKNFARAWARLAYVNVEAWVRGWADDDVLKVAESHAQKALALNSFDYDNHWALAFVYLNTERFDLAVREYRVALGMNGNDADLLMETAGVLSSRGEHDEATELLQCAMRINPLNPSWYYYESAWLHYCREDYERVLEELGKMATPTSDARVLNAVVHAELGNMQRAKYEMKRLLEQKPDWNIEMQLRAVHFKRKEDAKRWTDGLRKAGLPEGMRRA